MSQVFLHVDLDAFFASVELLDHPEWKGKPVIIGGKPEDRRSVVSTASYEARKYGVHSAMPTYQAYKLCPEGIFVHPRMKRYLELSEQVMTIFRNYSPDVQQISIDEAFIDLTGTEKLFGPPEQTALKLKEEVLKKTGLTVSVGIASTKYIAKIASEINKPDGLFIVPEGKETDFMLTLPLEKVWGVGTKSLERLKNKGITTTKAIYEKSQELLESLFGKSSGAFLYNAVRGQEKETFNRETKNHSLSAENTYSCDLTDSWAIDTALLELCHTVMFRMHRQNLRSSCVHIKIRYDDFSTFSVQEASDRILSSVDDLYDRIKKLFYKKYDSSRGIRLLGVGVYNTENADAPRQAELFDFGEEKKRKVEEAILKAEKKLPGVKITKARLIESSKALLLPLAAFALMSGLFTPSLFFAAETERSADGAGAIVFDSKKLPPQLKEGQSLFNYDVMDQNVEFIAEGYWSSVLQSSSAISFGYGTTPGYSFGIPVFTSQVDLSLWFLLNRKWYFEAAFADDFETNTVAAGFWGDGFLKEVRLANRGIKFPAIYSVDSLNRGIGGGNNMSPGVSARFEDESTVSHLALRYDMLQSHSKTWYGKNTVTSQQFQLSDYVTGQQYVLPDEEAVQKLKAVYVEASDGTYRDSKNRRYKKLDSTQYLLSASTYSVYLSRDAKAFRKDSVLPAVIFEFENGFDLISAAGSFNDSTSFLGAVQNYFDKDLSGYSIPFTTLIDGKTVYYVQYPQRFSPYAACFRYDGGILSSGEARVISSSTETTVSKYLAILGSDDYSFTLRDFFNSNHSYADIFLEGNYSPLDPEYRYPAAKDESGAYLGYGTNSDIVLSIRSYTQVSRFDIGTKAVPGTIRVYKNGIQDSGVIYDTESGSITLSSAVSASDRITAWWQEDDSDSSSGSITAAAGIKKQFSSATAADISMAGRWSYSPSSDSSDATSNPGYVTIASGFNYEKKNLSFSNVVAASGETVNTTGKLVISSMDEEKTETLYLAKNAAVSLPKSFLPQLNQRDSSSPILLENEKNGSTEPSSGKSDTTISGWAVPVNWDFTLLESTATEDSPYWAATALKLSGNASVIAGASQFSIALKNPLPDSDSTKQSSGFKVYLQLGVDASDDFSVEDKEYIPTWLISSYDESILPDDVKNPFIPDADISKTKDGLWQIITVKLTEKDRAMLSKNYDGRIIITSTQKTEGQLLAGPYEASGLGFSVTSQKEISSGIKAVYYSTQEKISKNNWGQSFAFMNSAEDTWNITRYFKETDLENYEKLSLKFRISTDDKDSIKGLTLTFERPEEKGNKTAVKVTLSEEQLKTLFKDNSSGTGMSFSTLWKTLELNLYNKKASVKGSSATIEKLDTSVSPTKFTLELTTTSPCELSLDEFYLSEATPYVVFEDKSDLKYSIPGTVLKTGDFDLVKDFNVSTSVSAAASLKTKGQTTSENNFTGNTSAKATLAGIVTEITAGRSKETNIPVSSASHSLSFEKPVLNVFNFQEEYSFNHDSKSLDKTNGLKLNLSPVSFTANARGSSDPWNISQSVDSTVSLSTKTLKFNLKGKAGQQLQPSESSFTYFDTVNYIQGWRDVTGFAFDTGDSRSSKRTETFSGDILYSLPWLSLKPQFKGSTEITYKNSSVTVYSDKTTQVFSIPFTAGRQSFNVSWEKTTGGVRKTTAGGNYFEDSDNLKTTMKDRDWYFKEIIFQDLFDRNLSKTVLADSSMNVKSTESLYYTGSYTAAWKRSFTGTFRDFYLPSGASFALERDIRTSSSVCDLYQLKAQLNYSSLNIFGSKGLKSLTTIFEQDEYTSSFTGAIKIPKNNPDNLKMQLIWYSQAVFYVNSECNLRTGIETQFEDRDNLTARLTAIYSRSGKYTPVFDAIKLVKEDYNEKNSKIKRKDSLNLSWARSSSNSTEDNSVTSRYVFDYIHDLDIELNSYATLNTNLGFNYDCTTDQIIKMTVTAGIGATVRF